MMVMSKLIGNSQTLQCQDSPVTLPGTMAFKGLDIMGKQENNQVPQRFFIQHAGIFQPSKGSYPVVPVVLRSLVQLSESTIL